MKRFKNFKASARITSILWVITIVVGGVAFAALQSQQNTLTGNTIETATANLSLSTDGVLYTNTRPGFDFNNLIPGGPAAPSAGYSIYLKNGGSTPLTIKLAVSSVPTNPNNVDLAKVNVIVTAVGGGSGSTQSLSLQSLIAASASGGLEIPGGNLATNPGVIQQQYKLQVSMDSDAITGSSGTLGNIDFSFSGVAKSS